MDELPRTPSGKVKKVVLREQIARRRLTGRNQDFPATTMYAPSPVGAERQGWTCALEFQSSRLISWGRCRCLRDAPKENCGSWPNWAPRSSVEAGHVLTQQGKPGSEFFMVLSGTASVTKKKSEVGRLKEGGYFGELAILHGGIRNATVTAATDMELWCSTLGSSARCS